MEKIMTFSFARNPQIIFGSGRINELPDLIKNYGNKVLLITGKSSFKGTSEWDNLINELTSKSIEYFSYTVSTEPSPETIDNAVSECYDKQINVVVSVGGGSVLDAGKAISAMLPKNEPIIDYLGDFGKGLVHDGVKLPFIAIPTTAGTGSEATKNAVIRRIGENGFKKSLRHDNFVPNVSLIDPNLMMSCPPEITSACGLDAFSQILEAYLSIKASPMTDALAFSGIELIKDASIPACTDFQNDVTIRSKMAYASLISGITLANAGLGIVHGIAGPIGGFYDIPHGIICGALLANAMDITIKRMIEFSEGKEIYIKKVAKIGSLFSGQNEKEIITCIDEFIELLYEWVEKLNVPKLGQFGITESDIDKIIKASSNRNNPYDLDEQDIEIILLRSL